MQDIFSIGSKPMGEVRRKCIKIALEILQRSINDILPFEIYKKHIQNIKSNKKDSSVIFSKMSIHNQLNPFLLVFYPWLLFLSQV